MTGCIEILYSDSEFMDLTPSLILVPPVALERAREDRILYGTGTGTCKQSSSAYCRTWYSGTMKRRSGLKAKEHGSTRWRAGFSTCCLLYCRILDLAAIIVYRAFECVRARTLANLGKSAKFAVQLSLNVLIERITGVELCR
eukprot:COSAG02_NODE_3254_length_7085_cov_102.140281_8_plen_142_part_00